MSHKKQQTSLLSWLIVPSTPTAQTKQQQTGVPPAPAEVPNSTGNDPTTVINADELNDRRMDQSPITIYSSEDEQVGEALTSRKKLRKSKSSRPTPKRLRIITPPVTSEEDEEEDETLLCHSPSDTKVVIHPDGSSSGGDDDNKDKNNDADQNDIPSSESQQSSQEVVEGTARRLSSNKPVKVISSSSGSEGDETGGDNNGKTDSNRDSDASRTEGEDSVSGDSASSFEPPDPYLAVLKEAESVKRSMNKRKIKEGASPRKRRTSQVSRPESDDGDDYEDWREVQEVSIHKIRLDNDKFRSCQSEEDIIKNIVMEYNSKDKVDKDKCKEQTVTIKPTVAEKDKALFNGEDFKIAVYILNTGREITLLNSYGIKQEANTVHSIIFHYRKNEIFALTTGQAWNVVQWCSDFDFPEKIAARLLSDKGTKGSTEKPIVGSILTNDKKYKVSQEHQDNPYDLLEYTMVYVANIRDNASILKLVCFKKKGVKPTTVRINLGSVRILCKLHVSDFLSILSLFSDISDGKPTLDCSEKEELDCTTHVKNLTKVHPEFGRELDVYLAEIIHNAMSDDYMLSKMDEYEFCHKDFSDFFYGTDFKLKFGRKQSTPQWPSNRPPTCAEVVKTLRLTCLANVDENDLEDTFLKRLDRVKLTYVVKNGLRKGPDRLFNFIEGLIYNPTDNQVYWHVQSSWFHLKEAYMLKFHMMYGTFLQKALMVDETEAGFLNKPWTTLEDESDPDATYREEDSPVQTFLNNFRDHSNFYIPTDEPEDEPTEAQRSQLAEGNAKLFDMIKCHRDSRRGTTYHIYLVTAGFRGIREKACQITNRLIQEVEKSDQKTYLRKLYENIRQIRPDFFGVQTPKFEVFKEKMSSAEVILCIGGGSSQTCLRTERNTKSIIEPADLLNEMTSYEAKRQAERQSGPNVLDGLMEHFRCSGVGPLSDAVFKAMQDEDNGYLSSTGEITEKLLIQNRDVFRLFEVEETSSRQRRKELLEMQRGMFDLFVKPYQPRFHNLLAKLELIRVEREIHPTKHAAFKVLQIL